MQTCASDLTVQARKGRHHDTKITVLSSNARVDCANQPLLPVTASHVPGEPERPQSTAVSIGMRRQAPPQRPPKFLRSYTVHPGDERKCGETGNFALDGERADWERNLEAVPLVDAEFEKAVRIAETKREKERKLGEAVSFGGLTPNSENGLGVEIS